MEINTDVCKILNKTFLEAIEYLDKSYVGSSLTDVFITVDKKHGEVIFFDDEENKIAEIVIFDWVEKNDILSDEEIVLNLRSVVEAINDVGGFSSIDIYKPFSVNYSDDDFVVIEELMVLSDDSTIELDMDNSLMEKFDREFDEFLEKLLKD